MDHGLAVQLAAGAVLLALAGILIMRALRRPGPTPPSRDVPAVENAGQPAHEPSSLLPDVPKASAAFHPAFAPEPMDEPEAEPEHTGLGTQLMASQPAAASFDSAIAACETQGNDTELAYLYIKQATAHVAAGAREAAASRLRDAIRVSALKRLHAPHALARIELGDLYLGSGDPITACEQWQIARNLFHDLGNIPERDDADKRMLSNGCPTDWVLTDF